MVNVTVRNLISSKLGVLGIVGIVGLIGFGLTMLPADARRAYDSSGSSSQSSTSTSNPYATNSYTTTSTTPSTNQTSATSTPWTWQNPQSPPQNQYRPQSQYTSAPQNQFRPQQNQYARQPGNNLYPQTSRDNGTNFYGIAPEQISGGAAVHDTTYHGGGGRGGYDARWNPNFGTGVGAQVMARESSGMAQLLRENFPLPINGDEAQMFQVNSFAARANGGMQRREP